MLLLAMASVDAGPIPGFYDRLHHGDGQHVFFVQGSAAQHLGLCGSSAEFVGVESGAAWLGFAAYKACGGSVKSVEAFAYSSCFAGTLLLALRLARASASEEAAVKEWLILQVELAGVDVDVGGCGCVLAGRSLAAGSAAWASLLSHLRPHQGLSAVVAWCETGGRACFSLQRLGVEWSGLQGSRLECFLGGASTSPWVAMMEVALAGRADAFPALGVCQIEDAMLVQKRVFWKTQEPAVAYAVQLTFVVFCRFAEEPALIWSLRVRHVYNPEGGSELWALRPEERVRGWLCLEWRQVGSGQDFVLRGLERASRPLPLLGLRREEGVVKEVDLFEGGAARWVDVWRAEDVKKDLAARRYWSRHECRSPGVVEILEDDVDVAGVVEAQLLRIGGQAKNRVKHEMLKERLKEKVAVPCKKAVVLCDFLDPYAAACQQTLQKLELSPVKPEAAVVVEEARGSRSKRGPEEWSESWSWKEPQSHAWGKKRWQGGDWYGGRGSAPPPPPPPVLRVARVAASSGCVRSFCHLSQALPHVYGEAAAEERLRPLVEMRALLETCGVVTAGREHEFQERMRAVVWDCLPHLRDDGSFWSLLEHALQECGVRAPEHYGLSQQALSCFSREDVQAVFAGFLPAAVWLRSADCTSLSRVPMDARVIERLVSWTVWLKVLEGGPRMELLKICLKELPACWVNGTYADGHGYHTPLLRLADLQLFSGDGGDEMGYRLLEELAAGVERYVGATFDLSSCWWPTAVWNACCWSVQYMERPKGRVDLVSLGGYLRLLNGVSRQFRKEALDLVVRIQDVQRERALPPSFGLEKGDFLHAESVVALVSFPAPKWPFE